MSRRRLYSKILEGVVDSATAYYLKDKEVEPGWILYITTGSVEDETNAPSTAISFGKFQGSEFIPMEEFTSLTAGIRKPLDKTHHFLAGEQPTFRFEGATLNDKASAYLEGYLEEI